MTKGEKKATEDLWQAMLEDKSVRSSVMSLMNNRFKDRDVGMYEIADNLLGHCLHGSSDRVVWCGVGMPEKRGRKVKSMRELEELGDDSSDILCKNLVENYYVERGEELEDVCLHDIVRKWNRKGKKTAKGGEEDGKGEGGDGGDGSDDDEGEMCDKREVWSLDKSFRFVERKRPVVVKTRYLVLTPERSEEYYQMMLQLYVGGIGVAAACLTFDRLVPWYVTFPFAVAGAAAAGLILLF